MKTAATFLQWFIFHQKESFFTNTIFLVRFLGYIYTIKKI